MASSRTLSVAAVTVDTSASTPSTARAASPRNAGQSVGHISTSPLGVASNGLLILKSANRCIVSTLGAPSHCAECCGGIRSARLLRPMTNPLRPDAGQHQRPAGADQPPVYMDDPPGRYPDGGTDTLTSATLALRNCSLVNGCALLTR